MNNDLQNKANPIVGFSSALAYEIKELKKEQVNANKLLEDNLKVNEDILEAKKTNHAAWLSATTKRFYVSLVTVLLMGSAFYVDIILEGRDSPFLNGLIDILTFWSV